MKNKDLQIIKFIRLFLVLGMGLLLNGGYAQKVSFTARGPRVVSEGEQFRFTYAVNAQGSNFQGGNFEGFAVLSGPNPSTSTSVQIINGKMTQNVSVSYNYILQAEKVGKYTITPASISVEGKTYKSNAASIEVVKGQQRQQRPQANRSPGNTPQGNRPSAGNVSSDDLFIRMLVSKREVRKGEPIVATLKLFTRVNLADLNNFKAPAFNGFWSETLREAKNLSFQRENVNGQIYNTAVIQQHVLIPERTGELTIEPAKLDAVAQIPAGRRRSRSLFDNFFNNYQNVQKVLTSSAITLKVNPLPGGAPGGYSGAVGKISLSATLDPQETKTNEPISLKVTYSGTGNLKLLSEPDIKFPSDFEIYDPKISNNYTAGAKGFSGNKTFEYLVIPRHAGDFEIPEIRFTVFDLETNRYKTMTAGPFPIHVEKGIGGEVTGVDLGMVKEDVRVLGSDIRYIKTNEIELREKNRPFLGSASFYLSYALSLGVFSILFLVVRRQRKRNEDVVYMKNKKAGRVAQTRLKQAKKLMDEGQQAPFYKELLQAQWGYLSDKLNIPQGELNKEKVRNGLASHQVEEALIEEFIGLMDRCEFAQFAPGAVNGALSEVYDEAAQLIDKLERAFK